jgi:hypothetical protein
MSKRLLIALLGTGFTCATLSAQELPIIHQPTLTPQDSGTTNGLIAVSPVNPQVVWASGRNGTFTVTTDGGQTWNAGVVPGAEALQFRDVQGFSASVAYLMSIGNNPTDFRVYKTLDGGATWTIEFENQNPSAFYDAFAFWTPQRGILHSDSVNGVFPDFRTLDGMTWQDISSSMRRPCPVNLLSRPVEPASQHRVGGTHGLLQAALTSRGSLPLQIKATPGTPMILRCLARPALAHSPLIFAIRTTESSAVVIWIQVTPITRALRFPAMVVERGLSQVLLRSPARFSA